MEIVDRLWPSGIPRILWRRQCPLCSSVEFKEAERHPLDRLLRIIALFPVRCVNCRRRYYRFVQRLL